MSDAKQQIDAYLASIPEDFRKALQSLRETIQAAAPGATEVLSYGMPAFKLHRPLVGYRAHTSHCGFYPMSPDVIEAHKLDLAGFETSKGTIRFTPDRPLPEVLVTKIVQARIREIESARRK